MVCGDSQMNNNDEKQILRMHPYCLAHFPIVYFEMSKSLESIIKDYGSETAMVCGI